MRYQTKHHVFVSWPFLSRLAPASQSAGGLGIELIPQNLEEANGKRTRVRERWGLNHDTTPGRSKTSTREQSAKLMADTLQEDRRSTCEKRSEGPHLWSNG
ncbi:hypothetical protein ANN_25671 [Periplaneta americana]|uniref:Uncharacterized protein n=1 Tax=Periplaneta americana TaxID=6978 RepID=A0ABQ8S414_PERAM|nr:hypothetical protein ANN_25671 [Periplaneta americana]